MKEKIIDRLKRKEIEMSADLEVIKKAVIILENNPEWSILLEAMNH